MADKQKGVISCHLSFDGEIWKAVYQTKEQKIEYIEELLSLYTPTSAVCLFSSQTAQSSWTGSTG